MMIIMIVAGVDRVRTPTHFPRLILHVKIKPPQEIIIVVYHIYYHSRSERYVLMSRLHAYYLRYHKVRLVLARQNTAVPLRLPH